MCHPTATKGYYDNNMYGRYVPPVNSNNYSQTGTDSYWRLSFIDRNGNEQTMVMRYSNLLDRANFLDRIQEALNVYGLEVENVTLMVPAPRAPHMPSQILITSQKDFTRALSLIPKISDMYNPNGGFPVRVHLKHQNSNDNRGYSTLSSQ